MSGKHTPGPWTFEDGDATTIVRANGKKIAETHSYNSRLRAEHDGLPDPATRLANARLIAAAPAMLEALKRCREQCIYGDELEGVIDAALRLAGEV